MSEMLTAGREMAQFGLFDLLVGISKPPLSRFSAVPIFFEPSFGEAKAHGANGNDNDHCINVDSDSIDRRELDFWRSWHEALEEWV
jgi:hypothetical protein